MQYSDNYYRAALIEAIAATVTPAVTTVSVTGSVLYFCLFSFIYDFGVDSLLSTVDWYVVACVFIGTVCSLLVQPLVGYHVCIVVIYSKCSLGCEA